MTKPTAVQALNKLTTLAGFQSLLQWARVPCWSKKVMWRQPGADGGLAVSFESLPGFQAALQRPGLGFCSRALPPAP